MFLLQWAVVIYYVLRDLFARVAIMHIFYRKIFVVSLKKNKKK